MIRSGICCTVAVVIFRRTHYLVVREGAADCPRAEAYDIVNDGVGSGISPRSRARERSGAHILQKGRGKKKEQINGAKSTRF